MPRGKKLSAEEKQIRELEKNIKREEKKILKLFKKNETKLKREIKKEETKLKREKKKEEKKTVDSLVSGALSGALSELNAPRKPKKVSTYKQVLMRKSKKLPEEEKLKRAIARKEATIKRQLEREQEKLTKQIARQEAIIAKKMAGKPAFIGPLTLRQTKMRARKQQKMASSIPLPSDFTAEEKGTRVPIAYRAPRKIKQLKKYN